MCSGSRVSIPGVDDAAMYRAVRQAMDTLGFSPEEQESVYSTCAGILHLSKVCASRGPCWRAPPFLASRDMRHGSKVGMGGRARDDFGQGHTFAQECARCLSC